MSRPAQSTAMQAPIPERDEEGRAIYLALLERQNILLSRENLRLRACLERATGTSWDSTDLADPTPEQLDEMVAQDMARGLRMSIEDARELVSQNKAMANPTQVETHEDRASSPDV
ncbi:hypothetical protein HWB99_gp048 [Mycobacterium phage DrLupo]|uniref:Uncharacterized protein n=1 Tax=Mycobacterium phage DrLupo TaxID=2499037 RepID=A0A3S9UQM7_9CAUD|nr:hypothetical protein HWB99_gp048 [Mycobacterium phage DrLupo]AZS12584.1 hypothetical protein SEA_DRLUPO_48 [Mycobacterium phage DrLupo]